MCRRHQACGPADIGGTTLIAEIRDAQPLLKRAGIEFVVADYYRQLLDECSKFLVGSGGSPIPEDFERIELVKYEPVFTVPEHGFSCWRAGLGEC